MIFSDIMSHSNFKKIRNPPDLVLLGVGSLILTKSTSKDLDVLYFPLVWNSIALV